MTTPIQECFGWRKYECPVPLHTATGPPDPAFTGYILWRCEDEKHHPRLNRWEGLEKAFAGFVTRGFGPPIATAYSMDGIFSLLREGALIYRSWVPGSDAAELVEFVRYNLLGVWMGERTPFLVSLSASWDEILLQNTTGFV